MLQAFSLSSTKVHASTYFDGGSGTPNDPYLISTCSELQNISLFLSASYSITGYIDCSDSQNWNNGAGFIPIGSGSDFTGTIEGNGNAIANLTIIDNSDNYIGFISSLSGSVKDLYIVDSNIAGNSNPDSIGGMVGYAHGGASLSQVGVFYATVGEGTNVGGLVGKSNGASLSGLTTLEEVINEGGEDEGGIVGLVQGDTTIQDFSVGEFLGNDTNYAGGVVGESDGSLLVQRGYVYGQSSDGGDNVATGGILGYANSSDITLYSTMVLIELDSIYNSSGLTLGDSNGFNVQASEIYYDPSTTYISNCSLDGSVVDSVCNPINSTDYSTNSSIHTAPYSDWDFNTLWSFVNNVAPINLPVPMLNAYNGNQNNNVGNWPMDEGSGTTTYDISGSNNHGTFNNTPTWTNGYDNYGINFDGTSSESSVSTNSLWPETSGSLSEWVNPTYRVGGYVAPTGWKNISEDFNFGYVLFDQNGDGNTWRAVFNPNNGSSSPGESDIVDYQPIEFGQWTNLTMTWYKVTDTYHIKFYVNGQLIGTTTWVGLPGSDGMGGLAIGNGGVYPDNYFNGTVDNLLVYNRNLSDSEVAQIANDQYSPEYNSPPQNLTVTPNNASGTTLTASISWDSPATDYNPPIGSYRLYYKDQGNTDWQYLTTISVGSPLQFSSFFVPGQTYQFEVCAVSDGGCGPYANITYTMPSSNNYNISNCDELQNLDNSSDIYGIYNLTTDIDCSDSINWNNGAGFIPIGGALPGGLFQGVLDGHGHTIKGLYIKDNVCNGTGIFSQTNTATIKNLNLTSPVIISPCNAGTIVGVSYGSNFTNLHIDNGTLNAGGTFGNNFGGFIGAGDKDSYGDYNIISNSYYTGNIGLNTDLINYVGGLVGAISGVTITNSYANTNMNTYLTSGGLIGYSNYEGGDNNSINNSYSAGSLTVCNGSNGGLVGFSSGLDSNNVFSSTKINIGSNCSGAYNGALFGNTDYLPHNYVNSYFDQNSTGLDNCFGYNPYGSDSCVSVDTNSQPSANYFIDNSNNPPLDQWDFNNVWYKAENSLPLLRDTTNHSTLPVIHLYGSSIMNILQGTSFTDPGAYVADSDTDVLMHQIKVSGTVNVNVIGTYIISYNVSDNYGNVALTVSRSVNVYAKAPQINQTFSTSPSPSSNSSQSTSSNNQTSTATSSMPTNASLNTGNNSSKKKSNYIYYYLLVLIVLGFIIFAIIKRRKKGDKDIEN